MIKILIVDDEYELRDQLAWAVQGDGREVLMAESSKQARTLIQQYDFHAIITDLRMETEDAGLIVLKVAKEKNIYTQVIVVTSYGTPEISVDAMRLGAFDYLERNAPGTDILKIIGYKITKALEFQDAKLGRANL